MMVQIPPEVEVLTPDIVKSLVDGGFVTVEHKAGDPKPFLARVTGNDDGLSFSATTPEAAVSAAWGFGIHFNAGTSARAVVETLLDEAEELAAKPGADVAGIYVTTAEGITFRGCEPPDVTSDRWPMLAAHIRARAVRG